ncbi:hypothetical protein [Pelagibacterium xiamenense]|uniref:hypothetical protein n=1 Tax=Pelagibacterium xiamenense TaxID=2901140 RepID=UPI001E38CBE4|nr:hypothetical protein [Pelagibacterium xiamenense]MCD7059361.1 hypothetical protein [Pelagibacterium xiamenense]
MRLKFRKGLDIGIPGAPRQVIDSTIPVERVGVVGSDYGPARFDILVNEGETVERGTPLIRERKRPDIAVAAPVSGMVEEIAVGARRRLSSIVIKTDGDAAVVFNTADTQMREGVRRLLLESGSWTSFRTRPFDRIPDPDADPSAIFVTAMDTRPHAVDARVVFERHNDDFARGIALLDQLTPAPTYVCHAPEMPFSSALGRALRIEVSGLHPAGLAGTHIHYIAPATRAKVAWHVHYQDVVAMGYLVRTGTLPAERVIALSGPGLSDPRLVLAPSGADLVELTRIHATPGDKRILSGSPLCGREARFLSRYHWQASVMLRDTGKAPSNWMMAALRHAAAPVPLIPTRALDYAFGTDLPVVALLRALSTGDTEGAERFGALELAEDDLALATYVTGGTTAFGALLRRMLDTLEAE